ncbi:DUF4177 domain-containing protein [Chryseobacterium oryctis]|uniref:DUF4177 domain-containing protein n=1 Tax=Chryseobacterium oryctis TaxID=2952618 RepID=A0ABT3HL33_9FLAO|nr:DUF4177 domain-containing protein [Chryseobacterium oryctis]MCW3160503.1 DUF4177 domain-containing protein [Chryseobacterium oryctis]
MRRKFEYKTLMIKPSGFWGTKYDPAEIDMQLNKFGSEGWELVAAESRNYGNGSTYGFLYTFKREI